MFIRFTQSLRNKSEHVLKTLSMSEQVGKLPSWVKVMAMASYLGITTPKRNLEALWAKPTWISSFAALCGLRFNINHLGNVYALPPNTLTLSQEIEKQVIEWNKKILCCDDPLVEGYVTSGATEANLFLMWCGKEWLLKTTKMQAMLVLTDFAHYSIRKAGKILGFYEQRTPISETTWGMDAVGLKSTLSMAIKRGFRSFLVPITLGYSSTGSCDSINDIVDAIKHIQQRHTDVQIFVWVDAAMQGLPLAFLEPTFTPLASPLIQGYVVDFHKLGGTPIPSGVVLYRSHLRKLIEQPIDYLSETDATVSGSRPGFAALAIWANISARNAQQWRKVFEQAHQQKLSFISALLKQHPTAKVISTLHTLTIGIIVDRKNTRLTQFLEGKYNLSSANVEFHSSNKTGTDTLQHYKVHFLGDKCRSLFLFTGIL